VRLTGVVATSQKFLLSPSKTGCLWGVFVSVPGATVEYGSIELIDKGAPPTTGGDGKLLCALDQASTGLIPNDIAPGDVIAVTGQLDEFLLSTCGVPPDPKPAAGQRQIVDLACLEVQKGAGSVSPKVITDAALVAELASGNSADLAHKWGGALLTLKGALSATQPNPAAYAGPQAAVSLYGEIALSGSGLVVNNIAYFNDLSCLGPKDPTKKYEYPISTTFTSFTGIYSLNYCVWELSLRARCGDVAPSSSVCTSPECTGVAGAGGSGGSGGTGGTGGSGGAGGGSPENTFGACLDGLDNDNDTYIDCEDKECCAVVDCKSIAPSSYCATKIFENTPTDCLDSVDNDGDGFIDCEDKGCCAVVDCKSLFPASYCGQL
jgi:hypothetical protein